MERHDGDALDRRGSLRSAVISGIGLMAAVDEIVFHQLLHWHHFYDRSTLAIGLISDGVLHAAELMAVVGGLFLLADLRRRNALDRPYWRAGFLMGAGGFQVFDGLVNHKVLGLHQIRYDVEVLPYDIVWNAAGAVIILVGVLLLRRARSRPNQAHKTP